MRIERVLRLCLVVALAMSISGCSWMFVKQAPTETPATKAKAPVDCTAANALPIVDAVVAVGSVAGSVGVLASPRATREFKVAGVVFGLLGTGLSIGSGVYGFKQTNRCSTYLAEMQGGAAPATKKASSRPASKNEKKRTKERDRRPGSQARAAERSSRRKERRPKEKKVEQASMSKEQKRRAKEWARKSEKRRKRLTKEVSACWTQVPCVNPGECGNKGACDTDAQLCVNLECLKGASPKLGSYLADRSSYRSESVAGSVSRMRAAEKRRKAAERERKAAEKRRRAAEKERRAKKREASSASGERDVPLEEKTVYTLEEAASIVNVQPSTVEKWIREGKLKAAKVEGSYRISRSELQITWERMGGGRLFGN